MRFIIAFLSLVALCRALTQGYRPVVFPGPAVPYKAEELQGRTKDASLKSIVGDIIQQKAWKTMPLQSRADKFLRAKEPKMEKDLSQLLNVLQRIAPKSTENSAGNSKSPELQEDMNKKPPMTDPKNYGLDELYREPASDMLVEMIEHNFASPGPFYPWMMQDISAEESQVFYWYLRAMETQWSGCINSCKDDWDGIPELFTRKVTQFVANMRFACPSAFFDKLFVRWSWMKLKDLFSTEDDAMWNVFYDAMTGFFTELPEDTVRYMAEQATWNVHYSINQKSTEYLFGEAFRDVAVFSWIFWSDTYHFFNTTMDPTMPAYTPYPQTYRPLSDFFWSAWQHSSVKCETGPEVMTRYHGVVQTFRKRYEQTTVDEIMGNVITFMTDQAVEYGYDITEFRNSDVIVAKIKEYIDDMVDFYQEQEADFEFHDDNERDMIPLYEFFKTFEDEPGFVWEMFTRLGLVRGPEPVEPEPLIRGQTGLGSDR